MINSLAIFHESESKYAFALDDKTVIIRLRTDKKDENIRVVLIHGKKYEYHLKRKETEMVIKYSDSLFNYYEIELKIDDVRLAYVFKIIDFDKSYYFSEDGLSKDYDFSQGFYNFFQMPYINKNDIVPLVPWMKSAVFYQIFVDRFFMGDREKDRAYINKNWEDLPETDSFYGGDLKGIIKKLDYLNNLGINTLYLTPIFISPSNHKYDTVDYFNIDPHFGTNDDFRELVERAHNKNIRLVLDAVFNHTSINSKHFQDVLEKGKNSKYFNWFVIDGNYPDINELNYECFASCNYMPKWNTNNKDVQDFLIGVGKYWIEEYKIDGWRLDVADELSHDFWRRFRQSIKSINQDVVLIGESWHDAHSFLGGDQFDGIMNYAFTKASLDFFAFKKIGAEEFSNKLNTLLMRNIDQVNRMNLNLLDSHDTHRFFTQVGFSKEKLLAALAISFMYLGVPSIYYGTEICLEGGYDPDCRRTFNWDKLSFNIEIIEKIKAITKLKSFKVIQDGRISISCKNKILTIKRFTDTEEMILDVNLDDEDISTSRKKEVIISEGINDFGALNPFGYIVYRS